MRALVLGIACALASAACGGKTDDPRPPSGGSCRPLEPLSDSPDFGSGPVACNVLDGYEIFLLDNFELGQASIAWYVNNDRTALSDPLPDTDPIPSSEIPDGRCLGYEPSADALMLCETPDVQRGMCPVVADPESRRAVHIRTGLLTNNGGQMGRSLPLTCDPSLSACPFLPGPPEVGPCSSGSASTGPSGGCEGYDLSQWDGVVLWARVGPNSADTIKVRVADKATDDKGCVCDPYTNQNDSSTGCDKFSAFITVDSNFRAYRVPFSEMLQGGWGMRSPGLDTSGLFSFGIEFGRGSWDLWIDDVGFYRRKR